MDYTVLALELIDIKAQMLQIPTDRALMDFVKGELFALNYMMVHAAPVHPKDLSRALAVSTARIAALLKHLEAQGLIIRMPDPEDNRQCNVRLTAAGAALILEKRKGLLSSLAQALELLGPEDAAAYLRIQKKLLYHLTHPSREDIGSQEAAPSVPARDVSQPIGP